MDFEDLIYVIIFLAISLISTPKKKSKPVPDSSGIDPVEEARKKIAALKRKHQEQTHASAKPTIKLKQAPQFSASKPVPAPTNFVASTSTVHDRPKDCMPAKPSVQSSRTARKSPLRQWIVGQIVLERKFNQHF